MPVRIVTTGAGPGRITIVKPSGASFIAPALIADILRDRVSDDAMSAWERSHPLTVAALRAASWTGERIVWRSPGREPLLKRLQIEVLLTCNLHCGYCYSTSGPGRRERLSAAEVLGVIEQADALGVLQIDFTGGEFFLDRAWACYVEAAREVGIAVSIHTNATRIDDDVARRIAALGASFVQVSVDSHLAAVHDAIRGRGALRRTLTGLRALVRAGVPIRIAIMAHASNRDHLPSTIAWFGDQFPSAAINVDRVIGSTAAAAGVGLSNEEFWELVGPFTAGNVTAGKVCEASSPIEQFEPACGMAYSYVYLTAEGEIAACPTMTSRESERFRGPDIRSTSLADAWYDSPFFQGFRYTNCENVRECPSGKTCGGGCRSNAYTDLGYEAAPDLIACNLHKNPGGAYVDFSELYSRIGTRT